MRPFYFFLILSGIPLTLGVGIKKDGEPCGTIYHVVGDPNHCASYLVCYPYAPGGTLIWVQITCPKNYIFGSPYNRCVPGHCVDISMSSSSSSEELIVDPEYIPGDDVIVDPVFSSKPCERYPCAGMPVRRKDHIGVYPDPCDCTQRYYCYPNYDGTGYDRIHNTCGSTGHEFFDFYSRQCVWSDLGCPQKPVTKCCSDVFDKSKYTYPLKNKM